LRLLPEIKDDFHGSPSVQQHLDRVEAGFASDMTLPLQRRDFPQKIFFEKAQGAPFSSKKMGFPAATKRRAFS
jgi:hypothetical protein